MSQSFEKLFDSCLASPVALEALPASEPGTRFFVERHKMTDIATGYIGF